jgi:hypothetical protein
MKLPLSSVLIGKRQRLDIGDLADLDTMSDPLVGQIAPIIVHKTPAGYELVDGRRRIAKAVALGWTEIDAYERDAMTGVQKQLHELFADIGRKDRTWQEKCLATAKIHNLIKLEKAAVGESWTHDAMASFTNIDRSSFGYMMQVAKALAVEPKDEEVWNATGYVPALQVLIARNLKRANDELERRRARTIEAAASPESSVRDSDATGEEPSPIIVRLHGKNEQLTDASLAEYQAVLGRNCTGNLLFSAVDNIGPTGFGLFWFPSLSSLREARTNINENFTGIRCAPFPFIWDRVIAVETEWPFFLNAEFGLLLTRKPLSAEPFDGPQKAFVSAVPADGDRLPLAVVSMSLRTILSEGQAVLLINVDPVHAAAFGYVPVWFEPNKERFDKQVAVLKEHYLSSVPGVTFE